MTHTTNESGRTMVEMLGVLAVIGVLTAGAISSINFGVQSVRTNMIFNLVEETAQAVRDVYSFDRNYQSDASKMKDRLCPAEDANILPDKCDKTGTHAFIATPYGKLEIQPDAGNGFKIVVNNLPVTVCQRLLDQQWTTVDTPAGNCEGETGGTLTFTTY